MFYISIFLHVYIHIHIYIYIHTYQIYVERIYPQHIWNTYKNYSIHI